MEATDTMFAPQMEVPLVLLSGAEMFRSIVLPSIVVCVIAMPLILASAKKPLLQQQPSPYGAPYNPSDYQAGHTTFLPNSSVQPRQANNPFHQASAPINTQTAPMGNPAFRYTANPSVPVTNPAVPANFPPTFAPNSSPPIRNIVPVNHSGYPNQIGLPNGSQADFANMTPDLGAAQTFVFSGDALGPDLNTKPMEFMPVTNLAEVIRFNVDPNWIKRRWKRVSTTPDEPGLHGLRVALVTGTNTWDLHGSLTYYFDDRQKVQRITFRGWTGDATRLIGLLTQSLGFEQQRTHLAGFYLAKLKRKLTGSMLMQNPPVIYTDNPVQQVAVVMEINNQNGPFELSDEFRSLIDGSQQSR